MFIEFCSQSLILLSTISQGLLWCLAVGKCSGSPWSVSPTAVWWLVPASPMGLLFIFWLCLWDFCKGLLSPRIAGSFCLYSLDLHFWVLFLFNWILNFIIFFLSKTFSWNFLSFSRLWFSFTLVVFSSCSYTRSTECYTAAVWRVSFPLSQGYREPSPRRCICYVRNSEWVSLHFLSI